MCHILIGLHLPRRAALAIGPYVQITCATLLLEAQIQSVKYRQSKLFIIGRRFVDALDLKYHSKSETDTKASTPVVSQEKQYRPTHQCFFISCKEQST